jgi:hypothetical protein
MGVEGDSSNSRSGEKEMERFFWPIIIDQAKSSVFEMNSSWITAAAK